MRVIIEAKVVRERDPLFSAREAVGQLHQYRYFIGPCHAELALLLDVEPSTALIKYLEDHLHIAVLRLSHTELCGGLRAQRLILNLARQPAPPMLAAIATVYESWLP